MKITRTVEVLVETREIAAIKTARPSEITKWCPKCDQEVPMITPAMATDLASLTLRTIYTWIETDRVHFKEEPDGSVFICQKSLSTASEAVSEARVRTAIDV